VPDLVRRFTVSERAVHWLTALTSLILVLSGLLVGRSGTFHDAMYALHLAAAGLLLFGVLLIVATDDRRAVRSTARELGRLHDEDHEWLGAVPARLFHGAPEPPVGRFNAGQKINFILVCALLAVLYVSGVDAIIAGTHHNLVFASHKLATIALSVLVAGHLYMAVLNRATRPALRGMLTGQVDRKWAREHHSRWEP
jgi:formate dehydrogenase subunit gamma